MAYMNQEQKTRIAAALKLVMPKGWKYSLAVRHHSTIVCTISEATFDVMGAWVRNEYNVNAKNIDVNPYHYANQFTDECLVDVISSIMGALNLDNYDNSDTQTDYFDKGHYVDLQFGKWNKPFQYVPAALPVLA